MQITNIHFASDHHGDYWVGDLIKDGQLAGKTGSYYTNGHRPSREDQIAALLFDERVIDPKYRTTLIYDGACGFCRKTAQWVRGLDEKRLLRIRPRHSVLSVKQVSDCLAQIGGFSFLLGMLGVDDFIIANAINSETFLYGVDAATEICELIFGPSNWFVRLMRVRPVKLFLWRVHYWVMNNRGWLIRFWNSDELIDESI